MTNGSHGWLQGKRSEDVCDAPVRSTPIFRRKLCRLHIFSHRKSHVGWQGHYHILKPKYFASGTTSEVFALHCKVSILLQKRSVWKCGWDYCLAMQMSFSCLSSVTKKGLGCRLWTDLHSVFWQVSINKLLIIFIMCNTSHFFCQIKYCKHLQRQSRARLLQLSELEFDIFWQKLNSHVDKSLLFSHQFFSPFSPSVSFLYCLPFCFYSSFFQVLITSHMLVREAFDS